MNKIIETWRGEEREGGERKSAASKSVRSFVTGLRICVFSCLKNYVRKDAFRMKDKMQKINRPLNRISIETNGLPGHFLLIFYCYLLIIVNELCATFLKSIC